MLGQFLIRVRCVVLCLPDKAAVCRQRFWRRRGRNASKITACCSSSPQRWRNVMAQTSLMVLPVVLAIMPHVQRQQSSLKCPQFMSI